MPESLQIQKRTPEPIPQTPTLAETHEAAGTLIGEIADWPALAALLGPGTHWQIQPGSLRILAFGARDAALLAVGDLIAAGPVERGKGVTDDHARRNSLTGTWRTIAVEVHVWVPEPTEREQLLARLAELDAAEGGAR